MAQVVFDIEDSDYWKEKVVYWAKSYQIFSLFNSNGFSDAYSKYENLFCIGAIASHRSENGNFSELKEFRKKYLNRFIVTAIDYEYSYESETNSNSCRSEQPGLFFFIPEIIIVLRQNKIIIDSDDPVSIFQQIKGTNVNYKFKEIDIPFTASTSKENYRSIFNKMYDNILKGNIYEVNVCQKFYIKDIEIDPYSTYIELSKRSPSPFSVLFRNKDFFVLSASPERFIAKRDLTVISQPIKGTIARGFTDEEDDINKKLLMSSTKDITENVMIADIVRNDLSKYAKKGTVSKKANLQLHSYSHVHQLVSTISCVIKEDTDLVDLLAAVFPMGSMTGAPKVSAMKLIDLLEKDNRGIYSGTIGYFDPDGDFDFNVIIRSLIYDQQSRELSFYTGGAVTYNSNCEQEYEECLVKASNILSTLGTSIKET